MRGAFIAAPKKVENCPNNKGAPCGGVIVIRVGDTPLLGGDILADFASFACSAQ